MIEEYRPKKKKNFNLNKKDFYKYAYLIAIALVMVFGISYSLTFFIQNYKLVEGSISSGSLTVTYTDNAINATNLEKGSDREGIIEFEKEIYFTNTSNNNGKIKIVLERTSGLNLTDMRMAVSVNGVIQEIKDVPANGLILESSIMAGEEIDVKVSLWPKSDYAGAETTFVGTLNPTIKVLPVTGAEYIQSTDSSDNKLTETSTGKFDFASDSTNNYVYFNCQNGANSGSDCETWRIVGVEDNRLVLTQNVNYTNASSRTNSDLYNASLTFYDDSMITSVSSDNLNVYLAKTVEIVGGKGTSAAPYILSNSLYNEKDNKVIATLSYIDNGNIIATQPIYYGRTNYVSHDMHTTPDFLGYSETHGGTVTRYYGDIITYTTNTNLYVIYQQYITLVYNANGGTGTMNNQMMLANTQENLSANTFTRSDYLFVGWSTNSDSENVIYDMGEYGQSTPSTYSNYVDFKKYTIDLSFSEGDIYEVQFDAKGSGLQIYFFGPTNHLQVASADAYYYPNNVETSLGTSTSSVGYVSITQNISSTYQHYRIRYTLGSTGDGSIAKYLLFRSPVNSSVMIKNIVMNKLESTDTDLYNDQELVENLGTEGSTVNLYAMWNADKYSIEYIPNTLGVTKPELVMGDMSYSNLNTWVSANTYTLSNKAFMGWSTEKNTTPLIYDSTTYHYDNSSGSSYYNMKTYTLSSNVNYGEVYMAEFIAKGTGDLRVYFGAGASGYVPCVYTTREYYQGSAVWTEVSSPTNDAAGGTSITSSNSNYNSSSYTRFRIVFRLGSTGDKTINKMLIFRAMAGSHPYIKYVKFYKLAQINDSGEYSTTVAANAASYTNIMYYNISGSFSPADIYELEFDAKGDSLDVYFAGNSGYLQVESWECETTSQSGTNTDGHAVITLPSDYTHYKIRYKLGLTGNPDIVKQLLFRVNPGDTSKTGYIRNITFKQVWPLEETILPNSFPFRSSQTNGSANIYALWGTDLGDDSSGGDGSSSCTWGSWVYNSSQASGSILTPRCSSATGTYCWTCTIPEGANGGSHAYQCTRYVRSCT